MATIFTHGFIASLLSAAGPSTVPRVRLVLLLVALAMIPDLDVLGRYFGVARYGMFGHRGFTHSILFALIVGLVVPSLVFPRVRPFGRDWRVLCALCFGATLLHGVMDSFTDAGSGIGFLIPFDDTRFFAPWRPLPTSPLGFRRFFNGGAVSILRKEFLMVWIPALGIFATVWILRRLWRGRDRG